MDIIRKYFPGLDPLRMHQFGELEQLYRDWNEKINVISRKDIDHLYERHVLHSLGIAKVIRFRPGTRILDVGTGGGFPGIPLAILFPDSEFLLVDSIAKKIKVVDGIVRSLDLKNVTPMQRRAEELTGRFDFIVSRAVTAFPDFVKLVRNNVSREQHNELANGILYLKGGDFEAEVAPFRENCVISDLRDFFDEEFFETKKIIHLKI